MHATEQQPSRPGPEDRVPLSFHQEFLCLFDQGSQTGPFGPRYHIVDGWLLRGEVEVAALQGALNDLVERHEALRTVVVRGDGDPYQRIAAPSPVRLEVRDLPGAPPDTRERRAVELLNEVESGVLAYGPPLLRAVLGRFDDREAVLVLVAHHTATDGWSMRVLIRELANRYAVRRGHAVPPLPDTAQYREYAVWQRQTLTEAAVAAARAFWQAELDGARVTVHTTDRPRSAGAPRVTAAHRFLIGAEVIARVVDLSKVMRSSPFMVVLSAYYVMMRRMTGDADLVVPTFTPGRGDERFQESVGAFFNFLPLRTDLSGCETFRDVVVRTRKTCLRAYARDIPAQHIFAAAPELMSAAMGEHSAPLVFQVFLIPEVMDRRLIGDLEYTEIRRRLLPQPLCSEIPDGALWTLNVDPAGDGIGSVQFNTDLLDRATVEDLAAEYCRVLERLVTDPDASLNQR